MRVQDAIEVLNRMKQERIVEDYAIGGAVGATFYLSPLATVDLDVFIALKPAPNRLVLDPQPIFSYLASLGFEMEGEYVMIAGWPVQFLAPPGPLVEEALSQAVTSEVDGVPVRVFSAEHLAAISLETGRGKDKARLLQFMESGTLDMTRFYEVVARHGLVPRWELFKAHFSEDGT